MIYLKYVGNGASLPDVPARDLTVEEAGKYSEKFLLLSGLYVSVKPAPTQNKMAPGPKLNKSDYETDKE